MKETAWKENGKLKLMIIVGTRPEIIRLAAVINNIDLYFQESFPLFLQAPPHRQEP